MTNKEIALELVKLIQTDIHSMCCKIGGEFEEKPEEYATILSVVYTKTLEGINSWESERRQDK